ncbi:class I SAM-dependent methyltransferase [Corynebacteriales bacterium D3-21]|uniref:Class I SAM-dependent methyltransferase n=1 Tax=Speluncibacter jeojiensis TaxID=2710754 RepID=A0A9X4M1U0_9ACTN|nr:class I SAM-dependent methyltransferase [Rhodococcus sp. D2-41]MDG3016455.1 class I SAM-dependent methyltransferase [Corynebacteriales bacterium D3-21]
MQGWEEFDEPVDRIVSIGAFEHFRRQRYDAFFERCRSILPDDGRMLLHSITTYTREDLQHMGIAVTREDALFLRFIMREIFPGGQLPLREMVTQTGRKHGFWIQKIESLQPHYAHTLDHWAASLSDHREQAIALASAETYEKYMKYLTGCARNFRRGLIDVQQFTMIK